MIAGQPAAEANGFHPVLGRDGMVSSQEAFATAEGVRMLREGGNAVDAAVAVSFVLAVTLPEAGNLGGGGFMLLHLAASGKTVGIDYREMAPASAHPDLFLNAAGEPDLVKARSSAHAVGVPGSVRGLFLGLSRYGTLPWKQVLAPAIRLAREGFPVSYELAATLEGARSRLAGSPAAMAAYFKPDGRGYEPGELLKQPDLAHSLELLAEQGPEVLYGGELGRRLLEGLSSWGGTMTMEDLKAYQAVEREPVTATYRGYTVTTMGPPSSGVIVLDMLRVLERFPLGEWGQHAARTCNVLAEAMKFGFADRARHLGDPDFQAVPVAMLLDSGVAESRAEQIRRLAIVPVNGGNAAGNPVPKESPQTTHFSVMDAAGNAVAVTTTLNFSYGCGFMAPGTGFLLNNEMDDFSSKPGAPNAFGLTGGAANAIAPRKRMASSMSPTIVFRDGKAKLVTGSPGGSLILSSVLQVMVNVIDHGMNVAEASSAPRIHHQGQPDELWVEESLSRDTLTVLRQMGYHVTEKDSMGATQTIWSADGVRFEGASDPRRAGALTLPVR